MQSFSFKISFNSCQTKKTQLSFNYPNNSLSNVINLVPGVFEVPLNDFLQKTDSDCFDLSKCLTPSTVASPMKNSVLSETPSCHDYEEIIEESSSKMMKNSRKIKKESVSKNQETSSSKKVKWTPEEDKKILKLLAKFGSKWTLIAEIIGGRAGKQVRERYLNVLRPGISHKEWTEEEDNLFMSLYEKFGKSWSQIAECLPGRTETQVKNRFYTQSRRQLSKNSAAKNHKTAQSSPLSYEEKFSFSPPPLSKESSVDAFFSLDYEEDPYFAKACASANLDEIRWN